MDTLAVALGTLYIVGSTAYRPLVVGKPLFPAVAVILQGAALGADTVLPGLYLLGLLFPVLYVPADLGELLLAQVQFPVSRLDVEPGMRH